MKLFLVIFYDCEAAKFWDIYGFLETFGDI